MSKYVSRENTPLILFIIANAIFLYIVWVMEISIETQFIPGIINGLTSAVSLILAISSASIAIISRSTNESKGHSSPSLFRFLIALMFPIEFLLFAYLRLIVADYYLALKITITSFIMSIVILFAYIVRVISKALDRSQFKPTINP